MSVGNVHSGRFGFVNGMNTVRNWSVTDIMTPARYRASNTLQGVGRKVGSKDWSGSFSAYGGTPAVMPGDGFVFRGYTAPDTDVQGANGEVWKGNAIVDSLTVNWNWESGFLIDYSIAFSGNGPLSSETGLYEDATTPDPESVFEGAKFVVEGLYPGSCSAGSTSAACQGLCVSSATLTITAENVAFINSCTDNWYQRKAGPIDFTLDLNIQNTDRDLLVQKGDDAIIRAYIDAADYWYLKWCHVVNFSNLTVDREGASIIAMTINTAMNGFANSQAGRIRVPGAASDWWPFT